MPRRALVRYRQTRLPYQVIASAVRGAGRFARSHLKKNWRNYVSKVIKKGKRVFARQGAQMVPANRIKHRPQISGHLGFSSISIGRKRKTKIQHKMLQFVGEKKQRQTVSGLKTGDSGYQTVDVKSFGDGNFLYDLSESFTSATTLNQKIWVNKLTGKLEYTNFSTAPQRVVFYVCKAKHDIYKGQSAYYSPGAAWIQGATDEGITGQQYQVNATPFKIMAFNQNWTVVATKKTSVEPGGSHLFSIYLHYNKFLNLYRLKQLGHAAGTEAYPAVMKGWTYMVMIVVNGIPCTAKVGEVTSVTTTPIEYGAVWGEECSVSAFTPNNTQYTDWINNLTHTTPDNITIVNVDSGNVETIEEENV